MTESIEKLISDIVDALPEGDLSVQKRFFLTQSLFALARTAHSAGHKQGCRETINEINRQLDNKSALEVDQFLELIIVDAEKRKYS